MPAIMPLSIGMPTMRNPMSRPIQNIGRWRRTPMVTATTPRTKAQRRRSPPVVLMVSLNEGLPLPKGLHFTRARCRQSAFAAAADGSEARVDADPIAAGLVLVVIVIDVGRGVGAADRIAEIDVIGAEVAVEQVVDPAADRQMIVQAILRAEVQHGVAVVIEVIAVRGDAAIAARAMLGRQLRRPAVAGVPA